MSIEIYKDGSYLKNNPSWHVEDSAFKAMQIIEIIHKNNIMPKTICETGCGAGNVLHQLQINMDKECLFWGYEISPQAYELCANRSNERLRFKLGNILNENVFFELNLVVDVIEHIEDYGSFLRGIKNKSKYKIFHIPLDLSIQSVLRKNKLLKLREKSGHIHYFTKEIALQVLRENGYKIYDYFYTPGSINLQSKSFKSYVAKLPRMLFYRLHRDFAVRLLGGFSLMILAE